MDTRVTAADFFRGKYALQTNLMLKNGKALNVGQGEGLDLTIPIADLEGNMRSMMESFLGAGGGTVIVLAVSNPFASLQDRIDEVEVFKDNRVKYVQVSNLKELLVRLLELQQWDYVHGRVLLLMFDLPLLLRHAWNPPQPVMRKLLGRTVPVTDRERAKAYTVAVKEVLYKGMAVSLGCTPVAITLTDERTYKTTAYTRTSIVQTRPKWEGGSLLYDLQPC